MALWTPEQLERVREIVRRYHEAIGLSFFGPAAMPAARKALEDAGLIDPDAPDLIEDPLAYAQLMAVLEDYSLKDATPKKVEQALEANPPKPLTAAEKAAVNMAATHAGQYCVGLGDRVSANIMGKLTGIESSLSPDEIREIIRDKTAANRARSESIARLKSDLGHEVGNWTRDWQRIAATESNNAIQEGIAQVYERDHDDPNVSKIARPDACPDCIRLYGPGSNPKVFKLSELRANGTNVGKKRADWLPVVEAVHPWCACVLTRIPDGMGWLDGELVPQSMIDDAEKSKAEDFDLIKAGGPYIGPKGGKWADPQHKIPWREGHHAEVAEDGAHFATGKPVTFKATHRAQPRIKPSPGDPFQQKIEPSGRYLNVGHLGTEGTHAEPGGFAVKTTHHEVTFKNPLVIRMRGPEGNYDWKKRVSESYGGKTGKALSRALAKDGHDGIVTVTEYGTGEVVDLSALLDDVKKGGISAWDSLEDLIKAAQHKYLRRIPTGKARPKYRYIYSVNSRYHGNNVQVGESVKIRHNGQEGHYVVHKIDDDGMVHAKHDETGDERVFHPDSLRDLFRAEHDEAIRQKHEDLKALAKRARKHGRSKVIKRTKQQLQDFQKLHEIDPKAEKADRLPTTIQGLWNVYKAILDTAGIDDHDSAAADVAYRDARMAAREKKGGKKEKDAALKRDSKVRKLRPYGGPGADVFNEKLDRKEKIKSLFHGFEAAVAQRKAKTWRDLEPIVAMLREVPGMGKVDLPSDVHDRHAEEDRKKRAIETATPEEAGESVDDYENRREAQAEREGKEMAERGEGDTSFPATDDDGFDWSTGTQTGTQSEQPDDKEATKQIDKPNTNPAGYDDYFDDYDELQFSRNETADLIKSLGPFIGPKGGKWADPQHKIPWKESHAKIPHKEIQEAAHEAVKGGPVATAAAKAVAAGADGASLKYLGAGMEGVVFEDKTGRAYKVARNSKTRHRLRNEAEALLALEGTEAAKYVPRIHRYDPDQGVIVRNVVEGRPGRWADDKKLREIHSAISAALKKKEWSAPEFKEDSFLIPDKGNPVMVDVGFVQPRGARAARNLDRDVKELEPGDDLFDVKFEMGALYNEGHIDDNDVAKYLEKIHKTHPNDHADMVKDFEWRRSVRAKDLNKSLTGSPFKLHGRMEFQGLPISIENRKGSKRHWKDHDGNEGTTTMRYPYGYIRGTHGHDDDEIDVYVGPDRAAKTVYVVHQRVKNKDGSFSGHDEDKVMLGFSSLAQAKRAYLAHYDDPRFLGSIDAMTIDRFKQVLERNKGKRLSLIKAEPPAEPQTKPTWAQTYDAIASDAQSLVRDARARSDTAAIRRGIIHLCDLEKAHMKDICLAIEQGDLNRAEYESLHSDRYGEFTTFIGGAYKCPPIMKSAAYARFVDGVNLDIIVPRSADDLQKAPIYRDALDLAIFGPPARVQPYLNIVQGADNVPRKHRPAEMTGVADAMGLTRKGREQAVKDKKRRNRIRTERLEIDREAISVPTIGVRRPSGIDGPVARAQKWVGEIIQDLALQAAKPDAHKIQKIKEERDRRRGTRVSESEFVRELKRGKDP